MNFKQPVYYILKDGRVIETSDGSAWGQWYHDHPEERIIVQTEIGDAWVSTVFLGLDHNWMGKGDPLLFETLIQWKNCPRLDMEMIRYATLDKAKEGHDYMVRVITRLQARMERRDG